MKRREFIKRTAIGAGGAMIGSNRLLAETGTHKSSPMRGNQRPNILLITMDGQQWQTIANRSTCNTPNINRLASEGMLFNRSYTPNAFCCPARAMLLTGAYGWHNGVFNQTHSVPSVSRDMRRNVVTYAMRAKEAGYNTGYAGKWHASYKRLPTAFGYDTFCAPRAINPKLLEGVHYADETKEDAKLIEERTVNWPGVDNYPLWRILDGDEENTNSWGIAETGINMMNRLTAEDNPWLMEFHFIRPVSIQPLKKYVDKYNPSEIPVPQSINDTFENKPNVYKREKETYGVTTMEDYQKGKAVYYAHVEQIDVQVGRILDALDKSGQAENTLVVCTTDHGHMVGDHGIWHMGICPTEDTYKIPMVIRWPGRIQAGNVSDRLVISHDLAHTYAEIFGMGPLPYADARSLLPLFEKANREDWREHIMSAFYGGEFIYTQRIAISDQHKYVFNGFDYDECYDLVNDPLEMYNIINDSTQTAVVDDMRARLWEMMSEFEDPYSGRQNSADPGKVSTKYNAARYLPRGKRMVKK
jgi:arylsulfatase A-like enzyme